MKKLITIILCVTMIFIFTAGCGDNNQPAEEPVTIQDNDTETETVSGYRFTYDPKAVPQYWKDIFGDEMIQAWYNLVDAALAGEDTFECPDKETFDWVIGQFPEKCFPVLGELIESSYEPVENGIAHFRYTTSREEFDEKMTKFTAQVEDILNKTMKEDYSDLEKALSLYRYFCDTYEYDYETYEKKQIEDQTYVRCYRLFDEGTGICQELATAYSFLLTQAGVDATIMMGIGHTWSYVRINGQNYHIDPTFVLGTPCDMEYFMMTDDQRYATYWDDTPDNYILASTFTQEHDCGSYVAEDDTFSQIWVSILEDFNHEKHLIYYRQYDDEGNLVTKEFDYQGF